MEHFGDTVYLGKGPQWVATPIRIDEVGEAAWVEKHDASLTLGIYIKKKKKKCLEQAFYPRKEKKDFSSALKLTWLVSHHDLT